MSKKTSKSDNFNKNFHILRKISQRWDCHKLRIILNINSYKFTTGSII
jgi:hypothetical protein